MERLIGVRFLVILAEDFDVKAGSVEVTIPTGLLRGGLPRYLGECRALTGLHEAVFARDGRTELESCSEKFKIARDDKAWHGGCKDECKDGKDDKDCCKDKNGKGRKDGTPSPSRRAAWG